jgi:7-cyano-7-deazaguanine synthase
MIFFAILRADEVNLSRYSMRKKAIILFSGGLDSTTCIAIAKSQRFDCYALSFCYGQKQSAEIDSAKQIAAAAGVVEHKIVTLALGGSALTDADKQIEDFKTRDAIPNTYVPARNTVFLSVALGYAETVNAQDIFIGANIMDYSGYPDCRPDYLRAFEQMANLATKAGVEEGVKYSIHAPLLKMTKAEIIQEGIRLGVDYAPTVTCYRADQHGRACGKCDSCEFRKKGFMEAKVIDPTRYVIA